MNPIDSLKGVTFGDVVGAYEQVKEGIKTVATAIKTVATDIIIPAFKAILAFADGVAKAINSVFKTEFTGATLLASAAILKFLGVFRLFTTAFRAGTAAVRLFGSFLVNFRQIILNVRGAALALSIVFDKLVLSLIRHPVVAALVVIGGGVAYLALKQTDAEKATNAHKEALDALNTAFLEAQGGGAIEAQRLEEEKTARLAAARAALAQAEAELALAKSKVEAAKASAEQAKGTFSDLAAVEALDTRMQILDQTTKNLADRGKELGEIETKINEITNSTASMADAEAQAVAETKRLTSSVEGLAGTSAKIEGWSDSMQRHVKKVDPAFSEAAIAARKLQEQLAKPPANQSFVEPQKIEQLNTGLGNLTEGHRVAALAAFDNAAAQAQSIQAMIDALDALPDGEKTSGTILKRIQLVKDLDRVMETLRARRGELAQLDQQIDTAASASLPKATGEVGKLGDEFKDTGTTAKGFGQDMTTAGAQVNSLADNLRKVPAATSEFETAASTMAASLVDPFLTARNEIELIWSGLEAFLSKSFAAIASTFQEAVSPIVAVWQEVINQITAAASAGAAGIPQPFVSAAQAVVSSWQGMIGALDNALLSLVNRTENLLARLRSQLASLRASIASAQSAAARGSERFATGGPVRGPGSPTSDTIAAWLSPGEFVIRAAAVDKVGPSFLSLINSGRYSLAELFKVFANLRMPEFSLGGMLDMPIPRFAHGGPVRTSMGSGGQSSQSVYLRIGKDTLGPMMTDNEVYSALVRVATREAMLSSKQKQWSGG